MNADRKKSILAAIDNELIIYPIVKETFETFDKELMFIQHSPNSTPYERPCIFKVTEKANSLFIKLISSL